MTDRKISDLVAVTSVDDADEFVLARSGSSNKISGAHMGDSFGGGSLPSGAGSPVGAVTPSGIGGLYIDATNGSLYVASGVTSADWVVVGGVSAYIGETPGVSKKNAQVGVVGGSDAATPLSGAGVLVTDAYNQWNGSAAAGLRWVGNGTDGEQSLTVANDAGTTTLHDAAGNMNVAGTVTAGGVVTAAGVSSSADVNVNGHNVTDAVQVQGHGGGLLGFDGAGTINLNASGAAAQVILLVGDAPHSPRVALEAAELNLESDAINLKCNDGGGLTTMIAVQFDKLGFFGTSADAQPVVPATPTAQDVVDALVSLGLVSQTP